MFTYFLGFELNSRTRTLNPIKKKKKNDDVWIDDLGGRRPQDLSVFTTDEIDDLALIYRYANIASAHLTTHADVIGTYTSQD